jgi:hypothetical protein
MLINGERALAYTVIIDSITPIEGADNIELAHVGGWNVITRKQEYKPGDMAIFCEIDSLLPEKEWSEFLRPKKFKVKTYKLGKFNVVSQGLLLPIGILPDDKEYKIHEDVTKLLGITYYVAEDNARKAKSNPNAKYNNMAARHKNLAKKPWFKWLMKRMWGRELLFVFLGRKSDTPKKFPDWIKKTDEDRIENCMWMLEDKEPYVKTEKIDGTSTTFFLDTTKRKHEFGVCSRNVRQIDENQANYVSDVNGIGNVYWEMAFKYDIKNVLEAIAKKHNVKRVVLQGETFGEYVQNNKYKLNERRFAAFNLIFDDVRLGSIKAREFLKEYDVPFVPIIDANYVLPDKENFEAFKESADGMSTINNKCLREGFVYRSQDGQKSFKSISRKFLLKVKD